jgi:hypothetical protein
MGGLCLERVARRSETPGGWGADVSGSNRITGPVEATMTLWKASGALRRRDCGEIVVSAPFRRTPRPGRVECDGRHAHHVGEGQAWE